MLYYIALHIMLCYIMLYYSILYCISKTSNMTLRSQASPTPDKRRRGCDSAAFLALSCQERGRTATMNLAEVPAPILGFISNDNLALGLWNGGSGFGRPPLCRWPSPSSCLGIQNGQGYGLCPDPRGLRLVAITHSPAPDFNTKKYW